MDVREFRIGNKYNLFLGISDDGTQYRQVEISGINTNVLRAPRIKINNDNYWHPVENFEPIPLTEEWLLKFGFIYTDDVDNLNRDYKLQEFEIQLHLDVNDFMCCNTIPNYVQIKYVHQLQNLYFALNNEELTLNN